MKKLTPQEFHKIYLEVVNEKFLNKRMKRAKPYEKLDEETKLIYKEVTKKINKKFKIK